MGFWSNLLGPRNDEPESEQIEREPDQPITDPDVKLINRLVDEGFKVNIFTWPKDRFHGKRFSVTTRYGDNIEIGASFHPTLSDALEDVLQKLVKLGLTKDEDPDIVPSVAPRGSDESIT